MGFEFFEGRECRHDSHRCKWFCHDSVGKIGDLQLLHPNVANCERQTVILNANLAGFSQLQILWLLLAKVEILNEMAVQNDGQLVAFHRYSHLVPLARSDRCIFQRTLSFDNAAHVVMAELFFYTERIENLNFKSGCGWIDVIGTTEIET